MRSIVVSDGCRLAYRIDGDAAAPPLLASNSLGSDLRLWEGQVAAFAARHRVIRYDARGHGLSDSPAGPYTMERLALDALELLDALGIARAAVCGVSLGGMVAMRLGAHSAERVCALVLANTSAHLGPREAWDARIAAVEAGGVEAIADAVLARWFTPEFADAHAKIVADSRAMLIATPSVGYTAACAAIRDMDIRPVLCAVRVPTLVIAGDHDPATPPAHAQEIAQEISGARLVTFPCAHLANVECAPAFNATVLAFLEKTLTR